MWNFNVGGAQKHTVLLGNALEKSGYEVVFLVSQNSGLLKKLLSQTIKVEYFRIAKSNNLKGIRKLYKKLKHQIPKGSIIIANGPNNFRQIARINLIIRQWKLIYILHNDLLIAKSKLSFVKIWELSLLLRQRNLSVVALSPEQQKMHQMKYSVRRIHLIPNFVVGESQNLDKAINKKVLCLGRLSKEKGHEYLIEAAAILGGEITIDIYGDGPLKENLMIKKDELGLSNINFFAPVLDVDKILSRYDFLILPSLSETFGMVLIEALNAGLPVVSSACSGPISIVKDRVNGTLVQPGNAQDLARGIQEMNQLVNDGFFDKTKLRESVSQYHLHNILPKYIELIKNWQD